MLFSVEEIRNDFKNFEVVELKEEIIDLNEGLYRRGMPPVTRFIGKKLLNKIIKPSLFGLDLINAFICS
ncbi:hypothetical protein MNBD_BACTEROID06-980 [hydrothermal vent metagenome]|uniref:Uncharacterized protein n=1 Tax=hydrothermal vent metagenome TaxID=652676 RepID=A0A3B0UN74_9ZZZZ